MPSLKAKDASVKAAKFLGKGLKTEYRIDGCSGLVLIVQAPKQNGISAKTWTVMYSNTTGGRRTTRKRRLGPYPVVTLRKAQQMALDLRDKIEQGIDVVEQERQQAREKAAGARSFEQLVETYLSERRDADHPIKTLSEVGRVLRKDALPTLGHLHPSEITDVEIEVCADRVARRGKAAARALLTHLRTVFNYALLRSPKLRREYGLTHNPADLVGRSPGRGQPGKYGRNRAGQRALDDGEIVSFVISLRATSVQPQTQAILTVLLYCGQRATETREMMIEELHLGATEPYWDLPAHRTKNGRSNVVPLSPVMVELLREQIGNRKAGPVFAMDEDQFVGEYTVRQAVKRLFRHHGLGIPTFSPHDLRRTVETGLARLEVPKEIRDRILNHTDGSVGGKNYNKHDYFKQKGEALTVWADHVSGLLET